MQKTRIRTSWKNKNKNVSMEELANAISAICWRMALNAAKNLHQQDFEYENDSQRLAVIREYLYFFIHGADRLTFTQFDQTQRELLVSKLCTDCQRHYQQNAKEIFGHSPNPNAFIESFNRQSTKYSQTGFDNDQPGFDMYRVLGSSIQEIMGLNQTNRWVIDQIMDIDGPNAYDVFLKSFSKLRRSAAI